HDRRRARRIDGDAGDVYPQDDARLSRLRLWFGAGDADVRDQHDRDQPLPAPDPAQHRPRRGLNGQMLPKRKVVVWLAGLIVAGNGFFPALWILFTSLKTETELMQFPITYLPVAPTLANYYQAFTEQPLPRFLVNSF